MRIILAICLFTLIGSVSTYGQDDDLLAILGDEEKEIDYAIAGFKTNKVINLHSFENTAKRVFDFKISHRFGRVNGGAYELFGLDNSTIRIGGDYGITDRLQVGLGRSNYQKTFDGYVKYKILRQSTGAKNMPITLSVLSTVAVQTLKFTETDRENYFSSRLFYCWQMIIGRKFSDGLSLQLSPTVVHRNLVAAASDKNDVYALAGAGRVKLSKRIALNAEYVYVLPNQLSDTYTNSLSIGFDIETGGHVFQLHFTNSTSMIEKGFIAETDGKWGKGDIHFGFNVSRVF